MGRYFEDYKDEVKDLFNFNFKTKKKIKKELSSIKKKVGVHLRLGDDLNEEYNGVFHKINYPIYLEKAMSLFEKDYKFINLNNSNGVEDMYSLSQCENIIMSNSSFSWW